MNTDAQFVSAVRSGQAVLVDFSTDWCNPCRQLSPIIDRISQKMSGRCTVLKLDIDKTISHQQFGINSVPTLVIFKGGKEVWRNSGLITEQAIMSVLSKHC